MAKTAYLASPIDLAAGRDTELVATCAEAGAILVGLGYCVYRPAEAWRVPPEQAPDETVQAVNLDALEQADLLVALLPAGVPTIGVPMEIERAWQLDLPIVVISDVESYALTRRGITVIDQVPGGQLAGTVKLIEQTHSRFDPHAKPNRQIRLVVRGGHELPTRAYPDDAGIDLTTVTEYTIEPGRFVDVHTQVDAVQLPDGHWGMITGRSSALRRWKLHVPQAVIDPGWRGPLFVGVWNLGHEPVTVTPGMRLGQLIVLPNNPAAVVQVQKVDDAPRGLSGFGSTG